MTVNERSPDDQHNDRSDGQTPLRSPSSCFFEWSLLPQHRLNGSTDLFRCDLCVQEVTGGEVSLKLHQIGLHINPYYLSASDRILAQISSYVVQTDKTEGPWVPDWDTFKGLYRCHHCFLLCNEGADLLQHLSIHKPIEDDLEDVPLVKRLKSPAKSSPKKNKSDHKNGESPKKVEEVINSGESQGDDHELKEVSPKTKAKKRSKSGRDLDERQDALDLSKTSDAEKQISPNESNDEVESSPNKAGEAKVDAEISQGDAFVDNTNVKESSPKKKAAKVSKILKSYLENTKTVENGLERNQIEGESPNKKRIRKHTKNGHLATEEDLQEFLDDPPAEVPESLPSPPVTNKRPDRKCKSTTNTLVAMLSSNDDDLEWKKLISMSTTSNSSTKSSSNNTTAKDNAKKTGNKVKKKVVKKKQPIKTPNKVISKPERRLSAVDNERVSTIVSSVLEKEPSFQCLQCLQSFPSFSELGLHKSDAHPTTTQVSSLNHVKNGASNNSWRIINREVKEVDADLNTCLVNALDSVPEVTFNNMHGTIKDIGSVDAQEFQAKTLGTVEKVKMNVSEKWTRKDVWESGWESSNRVLNWQKYQSIEFLQQMASVSWSEQRLFQDAFNTRKKPSPMSTKEVTRKSVLAQGLQLKQVNKSVKYMTQNERQKKTKKTKESNESNLVAGALNGEWEKPHDFMCSSCATVYDELREILHHKWEAHPYCLVTHVTLKRDLNLPPSDLMHPQVGRNLGKNKKVKMLGIRKIKKEEKAEEKTVSSFNCSKCSTVFEDREAFYVHVLECGGQNDWDVSKKKKKRKRVQNETNNARRNSENPEEAAIRKRARFERFNRPPPLAALNGGRMTRRQAVIIKKEKKNSRGKTKKRKRVVKNVKKEQQNNASEQEKNKRVRKPEKKKTFEPRTPTSDRIRRSTAFYGSSNTTPSTSSVQVQGSDEVRKIVQAIMEEMLAKVEKASKVIHQAEQFNLDVVKAKEVSQSRRNSTDSNCSLKHIHEQIPPVEEILDIVKEEPSEAEEATKDNTATEEIETKNRRSSFAASFYGGGNSVRSSKRRKSRLSKEIIENGVVDQVVKIEENTSTENSSDDIKKSEETIQTTETVDLNGKTEEKITSVESIEENEDKPVIQLKKRGRKPKIKTSKKRQKKINHKSETSKTTELLEEPKIEMNGVEESEIESTDTPVIPVTPKRRSTIAADTSIESKNPEKAAKSNEGQQRRKSIHNVLIEHSGDLPTENVTETVDSNDEPIAKEAVEDPGNIQAEVQCKTENEDLDKPIEIENPPKSTRPHRRSSFAASFYLSGSTELEDEIVTKRSRKRKQSSSPQDQPKPTVSSVNNEVIEEPSKETMEVSQIEDEEEKPIVHLKKRNRKSLMLESEPEPQVVESSMDGNVSNLETTEKPLMDENQPIKPRRRSSFTSSLYNSVLEASESEKTPPKKKKRRKKNHGKEKPIETKAGNETMEITPSNDENKDDHLLKDTATPKQDKASAEHNEIMESSDLNGPNESNDGVDDDEKPKRRSSFAASFYSAMPKSERSLRRSSGRVNYFEDIKDEIEEPEGEASISPIRRKKPPVKEITESVEPKRIDTDESISDSADSSSLSGSLRHSRSRRQLNNNLSDSSCGSSSRVIFPVEVKACAIQRIVDGETQAQVARDLDCPVSTIASWWHRRASILPNLAVDSSAQSDSASATDDTELSDSTQRSPKSKKKKRKTFNLNRNVLLSQMKERVEAAFVAAEDQSSADEDAMVSDNIIKSDTEEEQEMQEPEVPEASEEPEEPEAPVIEVVEQPATPPTPNKAASEESSNSSDATNPKEDVKIKNAILRNCFASLHRRQKIEKEKEYHQYLDNGN